MYKNSLWSKFVKPCGKTPKPSFVATITSTSTGKLEGKILDCVCGNVPLYIYIHSI